ncbi:MauE/DoxX family redox-associated membrane protein [Solihabitans fulvus]|uniref:MauE/DoxX family redox-associated membrane protein n=1 Tax=Solihabitans fulvus TaxID=1892852 RepID=UPI0034D21E26
MQGIALSVGCLFVTAGAPKVVAPRHAAAALRRVLRAGRFAHWGGRMLGVWEVALGCCLLAGVASAPVRVAVAVTCTGFVAVVLLAIRNGVACGCWAGLSEGPAGGAELGRAVVLAVGAWVVALGRDVGPTFPVAVGFVAAVCGGSVVGRLVLPVRSMRVARRLRARAGTGVLTRVGGELLLLGGVVHGGSAGGLRRWHRVLHADAMGAEAAGPDVSSGALWGREVGPGARPVRRGPALSQGECSTRQNLARKETDHA